MKDQVHAHKGFTIVEVLVFLAVFVSAFVVIMGIISFSSVNLKNAEYRTFASHYTDELVQWMRYQRDELGYTTLQTTYAGADLASAKTYCFNSVGITDVWPGEGECADFDLNNLYKRELTLYGGTEQLNATVVTSWAYLDSVRTITAEVLLSNLEP